MTSLVVTKAIEDEIDLLDATQPDLVDAAELLLESLYENLDLLERLHVPSTHPLHTPVFEVKQFAEALELGYNIYILKFQNLNGYLTDHRIFLGFNAQRDIYYALAITDRDHSYDTSHASFGSLVTRYEQYRIPKVA